MPNRHRPFPFAVFLYVVDSGDLIEWKGERWLVHRIEALTATALLVSATGKRDLVPADHDVTTPDKCQVVCNPGEAWPFVSVPNRPKIGRLVSLHCPWLDPETLRPLIDWVKPEPFQTGGAIFFNPALNLGYGDVLTARHVSGSARVSIPRKFVTVEHHMTQAAQVAETEALEVEAKSKTVYDRLMDDDDDE